MKWFRSLALFLPAVVVGACVPWYVQKSYARNTSAPSIQRFASGETASGEPSRLNQPRPRIQIAEGSYSFGTMAVGQKGKHTFVVRNVGDAPLKLKQGRTSCKCTLSRLPENGVAPGESANIELEWTAEEPTKDFDKYASFGANDPDRRRFALSIRGKVRPLVETTPETAWNLGELLPGKPIKVVGTICSGIVDRFRIVSIASSDPRVHVSTTPMTADALRRADARCGYEITSTFDGNAEIGAFTATVDVKTDIDGGTNHVLTLLGERAGPLRLFGRNWNPVSQTLHFETFAAAKGARQILMLVADDPTDHEEFQIVDLQADEPQVKVAAAPVSDESTRGRRAFRLDVTVPAGSPPTRRMFDNPVRVKLKTNHPEFREIDFAVSLIAY